MIGQVQRVHTRLQGVAIRKRQVGGIAWQQSDVGDDQAIAAVLIGQVQGIRTHLLRVTIISCQISRIRRQSRQNGKVKPHTTRTIGNRHCIPTGLRHFNVLSAQAIGPLVVGKARACIEYDRTPFANFCRATDEWFCCGIFIYRYGSRACTSSRIRNRYAVRARTGNHNRAGRLSA